MGPRTSRGALAAALLACLVAAIALLLPASPVSAASSLQLSRSLVAGGDSVSVQGYGFAANDSVVASVDLQVNGHFQRVQTSANTDASGGFQASLTVPRGTNQGTYTVTARDFHSTAATKPLTVLPLAYLRAGGPNYTVYVIPMHQFYASGAGFTASEYIRLTGTFPLYDGNSTVVSKTVRASASGSFYEALFRVPSDAKVGKVTFTATGLTSHSTARNTLQVFYRPYLVVSRTVRPGTAVSITGREFVPDSVVRVSITFPRNGGTNLTLSRDVSTDGRGAFNTSLTLPSNTRLGRYTVTAVDTIAGVHAAATVLVSIKPTIVVQPKTIYPGQEFTVSGENFGSGASITVRASFSVGGGKFTVVSRGTTTGSRGGYEVRLGAPGNAQPGNVTVTAQSANGKASATLRVIARPVRPSATATPTSVPAPTATATSVPTKKPHGFGYRYVSLWYHTVRQGTWDKLVVQSTLHTQLAIWVHVYFPNGLHLDYYQNTDYNGHWAKRFSIPAHAISRNSNHAVFTVRLWHGKASRRYFSGFTIV